MARYQFQNNQFVLHAVDGDDLSPWDYCFGQGSAAKESVFINCQHVVAGREIQARCKRDTLWVELFSCATCAVMMQQLH